MCQVKGEEMRLSCRDECSYALVAGTRRVAVAAVGATLLLRAMPAMPPCSGPGRAGDRDGVQRPPKQGYFLDTERPRGQQGIPDRPQGNEFLDGWVCDRAGGDEAGAPGRPRPRLGPVDVMSCTSRPACRSAAPRAPPCGSALGGQQLAAYGPRPCPGPSQSPRGRDDATPTIGRPPARAPIRY